jgi:pilus assembly protein Flp/PilA
VSKSGVQIVQVVGCFKNFLGNDSGSTAIEYGLIAAMLAITIIASLKLIRTQLTNWMTTVVAELSAAVPN